jgi:hypothetical protein
MITYSLRNWLYLTFLITWSPKKLVKTHLGGLPIDNQVKKGTGYDLSNRKLVQGGFTNLLE